MQQQSSVPLEVGYGDLFNTRDVLEMTCPQDLMLIGHNIAHDESNTSYQWVNLDHLW